MVHYKTLCHGLSEYSTLIGWDMGSSPPRRAFKSFNAHLAVDYPLLIQSTGPLNAWIWLADERSEVWRSYYFSIIFNYFQGNARQTYSLDRITVSYHFAKWFLLFQRSYNRKIIKTHNDTGQTNKYSKQKILSMSYTHFTICATRTEDCWPSIVMLNSPIVGGWS